MPPYNLEEALTLLVSTEMYWITTDPIGCRERLDGLMAKVREMNESLDLDLHARVLRLRGAALDLTNRYDQSEAEYAGPSLRCAAISRPLPMTWTRSVERGTPSGSIPT